PGQRWRARSHEAMADHIRRLARLPAGDRARLADADNLMAECKKLDLRQRFADARRRAEQVVQVRVELVGDNDIETSEALHALGHLHAALGDLPRADQALRRALGARERLLG